MLRDMIADLSAGVRRMAVALERLAPPPPAQGGAATDEEAPRLLHELRRKLHHAHVDAGDTLERLLLRVNEPGLRQRLTELRQPIHRFDYGAVIEGLELAMTGEQPRGPG